MMVDSPDVSEAAPSSGKKRKLSDDESAPVMKKTKVVEAGDAHVVAEDDDLIVLWSNTFESLRTFFSSIYYVSIREGLIWRAKTVVINPLNYCL